MRAVKAIALICALLALACLVGCGLSVLSLYQTVADSLGDFGSLSAFSLSGVTSMEEVNQQLQEGSAAIQNQVNGLMDAVMDSQMQIVVLFCGAVAFLLITMVLLVALRPERRQRGNYDDGYGY